MKKLLIVWLIVESTRQNIIPCGRAVDPVEQDGVKREVLQACIEKITTDTKRIRFKTKNEAQSVADGLFKGENVTYRIEEEKK